MRDTHPREKAKRQAAAEAARMARPGSVVGLGTGSTTAYAIEELGRRVKEEGASFLGIPTSYAAELLARHHGIGIRTLDDVDRIDLAIDGADEVDGRMNLIKGRGGAHTREKIVASFAEYFVVVVDDSKLVEHLGQTALVPVEVLPMAVAAVTRRVKAMGGEPQLRMADGPAPEHNSFMTQQGGIILDVRFPHIEDPKALECSLNNLPGVVENGIFAGMAHLVLVGSAEDGRVTRLE